MAGRRMDGSLRVIRTGARRATQAKSLGVGVYESGFGKIAGLGMDLVSGLMASEGSWQGEGWTGAFSEQPERYPWGSRSRVQGSRSRVLGSGFRVQGLGVRAWDSGFRVQG